MVVPFTAWSGEVRSGDISSPPLDLFAPEGLGRVRQTDPGSSWVWLPPLPSERPELERGAGGEGG